MTNEGDRWDPATVLGLHSADRVLVIGNPAFLPWLRPLFTKAPERLVAAKKTNELERLLNSGEQFTHIILTRETNYTHDHLLRAGAFRAKLVVFPADDGWSVEQSVTFYYPDARWWRLDSMFGVAVIVEPLGSSWRVLHG
jgi:hypothetical protein